MAVGSQWIYAHADSGYTGTLWIEKNYWISILSIYFARIDSLTGDSLYFASVKDSILPGRPDTGSSNVSEAFINVHKDTVSIQFKLIDGPFYFGGANPFFTSHIGDQTALARGMGSTKLSTVLLGADTVRMIANYLSSGFHGSRSNSSTKWIEDIGMVVGTSSYQSVGNSRQSGTTRLLEFNGRRFDGVKLVE